MDESKLITCARVRELIDFVAETGEILWRKKPRQSRRDGLTVGNVGPQGYLRVCLDGRDYQGHRIAWLWYYGAWPVGDVDHINGDRSDNRIANLRCVSRSVNLQNLRSAHRISRSGLLGAHWSSDKQKWKSRIKAGGKFHWLGYFDSAELAHSAYVNAKRALHEGCTI